jgi:hypothetical protein
MTEPCEGVMERRGLKDPYQFGAISGGTKEKQRFNSDLEGRDKNVINFIKMYNVLRGDYSFI